MCDDVDSARPNGLALSRRKRMVPHSKIARISREAVGYSAVLGGLLNEEPSINNLVTPRSNL
jgi:hypothetical protein